MKFFIFFRQIIVIFPIINLNTVIKNISEILKYANCHNSIKKSQFLAFQFWVNFSFGVKFDNEIQ